MNGDFGKIETSRPPIQAGLEIREWQAAKPENGQRNHPTGDRRLAVYLSREPTIPVLYYLLGGLLAVLVRAGLRRIEPRTIARLGRSGWHFFFLGRRSCSLEVQNISKAAVVLGNTWPVNAVIISGVMVMILLANLIAA